MGFTLETLCIQLGMAVGTSAVLMKSSGNVRNPPMPKTVSALFVLSPSVREMPDQASPKNAMMTNMTMIPGHAGLNWEPQRALPGSGLSRTERHPERVAESRPRRMADLLTGVTSIFCKEPGVDVVHH